MHFRPNWDSSVLVQTTYRTVISAAAEGASEERAALAARPTRSVSYDALLHGELALSRVREAADARARSFGWVPLAADETYLISSVSPSDTLLLCDFAFRRFQVGGRVLIASADGTASAEGTIQALAPSGIALAAPVGASFARNALLYPGIYCRPSLDAAEEAITDLLSRYSVEGEEIEGPRALAPSAAASTSAPVLPMGHSWRENVRITRSPYGRSAQSGNSEVFSIASDHSPAEISLDVLAQREAWWAYLQFFDSIRGRAHPFWVADPVTRWKISQTGPNTLLISRGAAPSGLASVIVYNPALRQVQRVSVIGVAGPVVTIGGTIDPALQAHAATRIVPAILCRAVSDTLEEEWVTSNLVNLRFSAKEVRNG